MDGLTIGNINNVLSNGDTTQIISRNKSVEGPGIQVPNAKEVQGSFVDSLKSAIAQTNQLQKDSDVKMQELATGKTQNIHETMIAVEKADIALRMMVQVRNKVIEAYQEIMRMQV